MITEWLLKNEIAPIETYGDDAERVWTKFQNALHQWACSEDDDKKDECFDHRRLITDRINAEIEHERKLKLCNISYFRNAAVEYVYTDTGKLLCLQKDPREFRWICECLFADALKRNMSMTIEELRAERKAHNKAKNAMRKATQKQRAQQQNAARKV